MDGIDVSLPNAFDFILKGTKDRKKESVERVDEDRWLKMNGITNVGIQ
jgi:hypothetical protein